MRKCQVRLLSAALPSCTSYVCVAALSNQLVSSFIITTARFPAAGKGRGLEATKSVSAGELLLIANPLAVVATDLEDEEDEEEGEEGAAGGHDSQAQGSDDDGNDASDDDDDGAADDGGPGEEDEATWRELQAQLLAAPPAAQRGLDGLFDGSADSTASTPDLLPAAAGDAPARPADAERIYHQVKLNSITFESEDDLMCLLRQRAPQRVAGLWREAAFINHSCVPNAVMYVVGDRCAAWRGAEACC